MLGDGRIALTDETATREDRLDVRCSCRSRESADLTQLREQRGVLFVQRRDAAVRTGQQRASHTRATALRFGPSRRRPPHQVEEVAVVGEAHETRREIVAALAVDFAHAVDQMLHQQLAARCACRAAK